MTVSYAFLYGFTSGSGAPDRAPRRDDQLTRRGVDTLVLAGISTSGVVLSTVRDAHDRDYPLLVLADACADPRPEVYDAPVRSVFPSQADVVSTEDLDALFPPFVG